MPITMGWVLRQDNTRADARASFEAAQVDRLHEPVQTAGGLVGHGNQGLHPDHLLRPGPPPLVGGALTPATNRPAPIRHFLPDSF